LVKIKTKKKTKTAKSPGKTPEKTGKLVFEVVKKYYFFLIQ